MAAFIHSPEFPGCNNTSYSRELISLSQHFVSCSQLHFASFIHALIALLQYSIHVLLHNSYIYFCIIHTWAVDSFIHMVLHSGLYYYIIHACTVLFCIIHTHTIASFIHALLYFASFIHILLHHSYMHCCILHHSYTYCCIIHTCTVVFLHHSYTYYCFIHTCTVASLIHVHLHLASFIYALLHHSYMYVAG